MAHDLKHLFTHMTATEAAQRLLGCEFEREIAGEYMRVRIVETEAYDQEDAASHSFNGQTPRTDVMFGEAGHLYVYFTYGMHYCCNVVTGPSGVGAGVLIRAVEPLSGIEAMTARRNKDGVELTNGPAKLCQALAIDRKLSGHDLTLQPLRLIIKEPIKSARVTRTTRIGISKAKDELRRFYLTDNPYVSK